MKTGKSDASGRAALLIVDVINAFDFEGGESLLRQTRRVAPQIDEVRTAFANSGLPVIYCNDNFGQWRSDFRTVVDRCTAPGAIGADIVERLRPQEDSYFVLKPKHSAFYATALDLLLRSLRARHVVVAGVAGDGCVLATATDAHIRDYEVSVVGDATASQSIARNKRVLALLADTEIARIVTAADVASRIVKSARRGKRDIGN